MWLPESTLSCEPAAYLGCCQVARTETHKVFLGQAKGCNHHKGSKPLAGVHWKPLQRSMIGRNSCYIPSGWKKLTTGRPESMSPAASEARPSVTITLGEGGEPHTLPETEGPSWPEFPTKGSPKEENHAPWHPIPTGQDISEKHTMAMCRFHPQRLVRVLLEPQDFWGGAWSFAH